MTASVSTQSASVNRASMLLVGERTDDESPAAAQMLTLLHQLGLLADTAGATAVGGSIRGPVSLRFGVTDVTLTIGDANSVSPLGGVTDLSLVPIWQGVPACRFAEGKAWVRLDIAIAPDDDRVMLAQRLFTLSALLASRLPVTRLCWLPNQLWSDPRQLADAVIAVERLGLPPVMHLIGFIPDADGRVTTRGLDWFGLEDVRITAPDGMAVADLVRRAARLAAEQLAVRAPLRRGRYPGIERGEWVSVDPADAATGRPLCDAVIELPSRR